MKQYVLDVRYPDDKGVLNFPLYVNGSAHYLSISKIPIVSMYLDDSGKEPRQASSTITPSMVKLQSVQYVEQKPGAEILRREGENYGYPHCRAYVELGTRLSEMLRRVEESADMITDPLYPPNTIALLIEQPLTVKMLGDSLRDQRFVYEMYCNIVAYYDPNAPLLDKKSPRQFEFETVRQEQFPPMPQHPLVGQREKYDYEAYCSLIAHQMRYMLTGWYTTKQGHASMLKGEGGLCKGKEKGEWWAKEEEPSIPPMREEAHVDHAEGKEGSRRKGKWVKKEEGWAGILGKFLLEEGDEALEVLEDLWKGEEHPGYTEVLKPYEKETPAKTSPILRRKLYPKPKKSS